MKFSTQLRPNTRSLTVVMAAAYGLAASPHGHPSFLDLADDSSSLRTGLTTPFKLDKNQIMTVTPIAKLGKCFPTKGNGPMTLTLQKDEFMDLCSSWSTACNIQLGAHILHYIYHFTDGQVSGT